MAKLVSASDDRMARVVELYEGLSASSRKAPNKLLEKLCIQAGIDPSDFLGKCAAAAHKAQFEVAAILASSHLEEIVAVGVELAKQPDGLADRRLIYEHMSFLPQKQGVGVAIQVNSQGPVALPSFTDLAQLASQAVGTQRQLPEAVGEEVIEGELINSPISDSLGITSGEAKEVSAEENS